MTADFDKLIHDVNSQCSSLRSAAALLKDCPPKESGELLTMMVRQAEILAQILSDFERTRKV